MRARGVEVELAAWDDPAVDWSRYTCAIVRSTWNYVHAHVCFVAWARAVPTRLWNGAETLAWNSDKAYLVRFAVEGIATVPTVLVERGSTDDLRHIATTATVVVKPRISAGSFETHRFEVATLTGGELARCAAERDVLVQPYVASVEGRGERSLVWIAGALTHAIRKSPRFVGHEESVGPVRIEDDERRFALSVLAHVAEPLLYARIDVARADDGSVMLMELELIEPSLFLRHSGHALERFADAIARL